MIIKKQNEACSQGRISRMLFIRNVFLGILGIVLTMTLAGLLGNYLGKLATRQIYDAQAKFLVGIFIGLLVGIAIGIFVQRIRKKLLWIFQKSTLGLPNIRDLMSF